MSLIKIHPLIYMEPKYLLELQSMA